MCPSLASSQATTGGLSTYVGERAECSLFDGHAMTNVSVVNTVTLQSRPPNTRTSIRYRAESCRRTHGSAKPQQHVALQSALSASEPRRERFVTPPSHQRAAWIFNPRCVGNGREQSSHLCANFRASTSTCLLRFARAASVTSVLSCACRRVGWCDAPWWHSQRVAPSTLRTASLWTVRQHSGAVRGMHWPNNYIEKDCQFTIGPLGLRWNSCIIHHPRR